MSLLPRLYVATADIRKTREQYEDFKEKFLVFGGGGHTTVLEAEQYELVQHKFPQEAGSALFNEPDERLTLMLVTGLEPGKLSVFHPLYIRLPQGNGYSVRSPIDDLLKCHQLMLRAKTNEYIRLNFKVEPPPGEIPYCTPLPPEKRDELKRMMRMKGEKSMRATLLTALEEQFAQETPQVE